MRGFSDFARVQIIFIFRSQCRWTSRLLHELITIIDESAHSLQVPSLVEALIEEEEEEDPCSGKQCTANEHCCDGHVCVDVDENDQNPGETQTGGMTLTVLVRLIAKTKCS